MSTLNPRDVLEYLHELGYQNISALELKEFIKDLKKLIKYEQRIQEDQENHVQDTYPQSTHRTLDIFTSLHEAGTTSSKAKKVSKKEKVISVQIKKPHYRCSEQEESIHKTDSLGNSSRLSNEILNSNYEQSDVISENVENIFRHRSKSSGNTETIASQNLKLKPRASFIRPRIPLKPCKSDPVALYHQYQAEWKRQKIPGEDNRADLRWVIREKMLGNTEFASTAQSFEKLKRKRTGTRL